MKHFYLLLFLCPLLLNAQIFVDRDASGSNDGSSWNNAYMDLQEAILNAPEGAEVWVAAGIYLPNTNADVDATFALTQSVDLYGGFDGTETNLTERSIEGNLTILSGDYNADDDIVVATDPLSILFNNTSEKAKRVVTASNITGSITLDGFTISGGKAPSSGGAMQFSPDTELTVLIKNCIIKNNHSIGTAGAIRIGAGDNKVLNFRLENSSVLNNACLAGYGKGGAIWATGGGTTNAEYINVMFHQNSSASRGGAVNHDEAINPTFENCIFSGNQAAYGGAVLENINFTSSFTNCTFYNNTATTQGSAIYKFNFNTTLR